MFRPDPKSPSKEKKVCRVQGCKNPIWSRGVCKKHTRYVHPKKNDLVSLPFLFHKTKNSLIDVADIIFSQLIKLLFGKQCYTCTYYGNLIECGHFISRKNWLVRWYINNGRPQCIPCNHEKHGNLTIFEERLRKEVGDAEVDMMLSYKHETYYKPRSQEMKTIIADLKKQTDEAIRDRKKT